MKYLLIALALVAGSIAFVAPASAQILGGGEGSTISINPNPPPGWCQRIFCP